MIAAAEPDSTFPTAIDGEIQLATFYVGDLFVGVEIDKVQEINRRTDLVPAPGAPSHVRGVVNLRGDVVTVLDLRQILGLPSKPIHRQNRNVVTHSNGELIGLLVDRIADILSISSFAISPAPANLDVNEELLRGVCRTDKEILLILNLDHVLA